MFQSWRLKLREAEAAFRGGQLDEASHLLVRQRLRDYAPGRKLGVKVAGEIARRGQRQAALGDTSAGWRDLAIARQLAGETEMVLSARREMVAEALVAVENCLEAGDGAAALARLDRLHRRDVTGGAVQRLRELALKVEQANRIARAGRFGEAADQLEGAAVMSARSDFLLERRRRWQQLEPQAETLRQRLHQLMADRRWNETLDTAERLLRIAPESSAAHEARRLAWRRVGAKLRQPKPISPDSDQQRNGMSEQARGRSLDTDPRFALWVDAVGGFLVVAAERVVLGQAIPGSSVEVPILGDCSREHAVIRRVPEGYLLEPLAGVALSGRPIDQTTLLTDGDEIQLGASIQFRFRRPHPLSASARLEPISRHRLQPSVDAVLLMAESCVLGPKLHNHVVCRDWAEDVVLYRKGKELYCRGGGALEIDGKAVEGKGPITHQSRIAGEDYTLSLERV